MTSKKPVRLDENQTLAALAESSALDRFDAGDLQYVECEPGWFALVAAGALQELIPRLQSAANHWLAGELLNTPLAKLLRPIAKQSDKPPTGPSRRPPIRSADAMLSALGIEAGALDTQPAMSGPPSFGSVDGIASESGAAIDALEQASGAGPDDVHGETAKGGLGDAEVDAVDAVDAQASAAESLQREEVRLDVVTPETAFVDEPFDMAVAIRQPASPALAIEDLPKLTSTTGDVYRSADQDVIKYRVEVEVDDCDVKPARYDFLLARGRDSIVQYFQLTPRRAGNLSIVVNAYQADGAVLAATTRVRLKAGVAVIADSSSAAAQADAVKLYEVLSSRFDLNDLQDVSLRLGIAWDELAGDTLSAKGRSLLAYSSNRGRLNELRQLVKTLRPDAGL